MADNVSQVQCGCLVFLAHSVFQPGVFWYGLIENDDWQLGLKRLPVLLLRLSLAREFRIDLAFHARNFFNTEVRDQIAAFFMKPTARIPGPAWVMIAGGIW